MTMEDRLRNWGSVMRSPRFRSGTCAVWAHWFIALRDQGTRAPEAGITRDEADAWAIERAWREIANPVTKTLLKAWYVQDMNFGQLRALMWRAHRLPTAQPTVLGRASNFSSKGGMLTGSVFAEFFVVCMLCSSAAHASMPSLPAALSGATNNAWIKYLWVLLIALLAWAASSLPVLADWRDGRRRRLLIAQGILQSVFFGFVAFWASTSGGQNVLAGYIATASAAYLSERHVTRARKTTGSNVSRESERDGG